MASIAESSVGSLPLAQLAQLQEQILQGRAVLPDSEEGTARTRTNDEIHDEEVDGQGDAEDGNVIDESANAYRTPISSPKTNALKLPPRLESAKSAPPVEMEAMVNPSPSQDAFKEMTRANSFHGFAGGDTQPLESQVYEDFHQSVAHKSMSTNATTPKKDKMVLQVSPEGRVEYTYGTEGTGRTPRTCREGEEGYVDLEGAFEGGERSPEGSLGDSVNGESPGEDVPEPGDVFRKPAMPETPSVAGQKRRREEDAPTSGPSAKKTPGFSQVFGFKAQKGDVMTGTQLFEQTQARSSPLPDVPRSDPALTRPSPNMQHHMNVSSPTIMMSSPIANRAPPPATAGEPRETYTSMLESQERKRARLEGDFGLKQPRQSGETSDFEEEEEDPERKRFANQRLQRALSDQALHELRRVDGRARPSSRPATSSSPQKGAMIDLRTPATAKKGADFEFDVSDDGHDPGGELMVESEEQGPDDEAFEEDEQMGDVANEDEGQIENDVYDEFAQTVLRSQGPGDDDGDDEDERGEAENVDGREDDDVDMPDDARQHGDEDVPQRTLVQGSSQQDRSNFQRRSQTATQHSAIADSQPFRGERQQASASQPNANGSPSCSYVPGSQYAGKTSQDQTSLSGRRGNASMGPPVLSASKSQENQQVVPSSPPVAATNGISVNYTAEASLERRNMLAQFQTEQQDTEQPPEQEIPESDLRAPDQASSCPATAEDRPNTGSNNAPFSTARSHLSANAAPMSQQDDPSAPSPLKVFASQQGKVSSQSPRTKAGVRRFADLAGAPLGSAESAGEVDGDVDAVMNGFLDDGDRAFIEATSSPPKERERVVKRRRVGWLPTVRSSSPVKEPEAETVSQPALVERGDDEMSGSRDGTPVEAEVLDSRALQNSPSKANEQRAVSEPPESTAESVKARELAGAKAASQLLTKRSARNAKPARLSAGNGRKSRSKLQREETVGDDDDDDDGEDTPKAKKKKSKRAAKEAAQPIEQEFETKNHPKGTEEPEIEETVVGTNDDAQDVGEDQRGDAPAVVAPHRIFALFKGTFNMFYPATWIATSTTGGGSHRIKFDDGTVTSIDAHLVCRLELSLGDQVKVDHPGMKNKVWIVKGFGPALPADRATAALADIHGHETVHVQAKSTRNSTSGPNAVVQGEGEIFNFAIEVVYLTQSMWTHFSSRHFQHGVGQSAAAASRFATPSTGVQTPVDNETPTSRSRRVNISTAKTTDKRGSVLRDESANASRISGDGLFRGMAFAVSYGQNESEKMNVTRLIQRNGGTILDEGFEGLFDTPDLDGSDTIGTTKAASQSTGLRPKPEHKYLGFVALIADKHSRRAKYIQALALGLPTLSGRWITDSLSPAKNPPPTAAPLPWSPYLLAAGESSYLSGAVRSRNIAPSSAADAKLADTIANRPCLIEGDGVVIVASAKKAKAVWERRKAFAFLTLALGAGDVRRVSDLQEAKTLCASEPGKWKFVYVDGSVVEASGVVFGKDASGPGGGKKRKREEGEGKKVDAKAMVVQQGSVRIVDDEFVVQSLILGALVD